jgi:hypothetical protein
MRLSMGDLALAADPIRHCWMTTCWFADFKFGHLPVPALEWIFAGRQWRYRMIFRRP